MTLTDSDLEALRLIRNAARGFMTTGNRTRGGTIHYRTAERLERLELVEISLRTEPAWERRVRLTNLGLDAIRPTV